MYGSDMKERVDAEKEDQLMIDKLLKANEEAHQNVD